MRLIFLLVILAAPLAAFPIERFPRVSQALFDVDLALGQTKPGPGSGTEEKPSTQPTGTVRSSEVDKDARYLSGWNDRGYGLSAVATGALLFPAVAIGLEFVMPVHPQIGIFLRGQAVGGVFFEGSCFDLGLRAYYDVQRNLTLYHDVGFRLMYGRITQYLGESLDSAIHRLGFGGVTNLGFEAGAKWIRFFFEVTINGAKTLDEEFEVLFFCGVNFGVRFYIGAE